MTHHRILPPRWAHEAAVLGCWMLISAGVLGGAIGCLWAWRHIDPYALTVLAAFGGGLLGAIPGTIALAWHVHATRHR